MVFHFRSTSQGPTPYTTWLDTNKARGRFRRRAGIEPVIGHLKHDNRMTRNYLKGAVGDAINLFMAAAAYNFRKWMRAVVLFFAFLIFGRQSVQMDSLRLA